MAVGISIHALREEGDRSCRGFCRRTCRNFYPRPPRGGRPGLFVEAVRIIKISIHALREEGDTSNRDTLTWVAYFYPRPPRGGRPTAGGLDLLGQGFLSTPSARRATVTESGRNDLKNQFLSTPSARRATLYLPVAGQLLPYFYPRPPRGGRPGRKRAGGDGG